MLAIEEPVVPLTHRITFCRVKSAIDQRSEVRQGKAASEIRYAEIGTPRQRPAWWEAMDQATALPQSCPIQTAGAPPSASWSSTMSATNSRMAYAATDSGLDEPP